MFSLQKLLEKKDKFFGLVEKIIGRWRDAGNVIAHIVLKNS